MSLNKDLQVDLNIDLNIDFKSVKFRKVQEILADPKKQFIIVMIYSWVVVNKYYFSVFI